MRISRTSRRTYGAALAVAVATPVCLAPLAQAAPADEPGQLLTMTRQYLQDRASRVTDARPVGLTGTALTSVTSTSSFAPRLAAETAPLDRLRAAITGTHAQYRKAEVDLAHPAVTVTGDTARVTVEERTRLLFAIRDSADSAEATRYRVPHVLDFQRRGAAGPWPPTPWTSRPTAPTPFPTTTRSS